jgi:hypothetical protein
MLHHIEAAPGTRRAVDGRTVPPDGDAGAP